MLQTYQVQVRVMVVALCNIVFTGLVTVEVSSQEDAFTLTASLRLDDESLCLAKVKLLLE